MSATPKKRYIVGMYEVGAFIFQGFSVLVGLFLLLIMIAMCGWFGYAVGGAIGDEFGKKKDSEDNGGFIGMIVGVVVGIILMVMP